MIIHKRKKGGFWLRGDSSVKFFVGPPGIPLLQEGIQKPLIPYTLFRLEL